VIVGHTMGTTIGINTMLLLAFAYNILGNDSRYQLSTSRFSVAYNITQISLASFWLALIVAGFLKSYWQMTEPTIAYGELWNRMRPLFYIFYVAGLGLAVGLLYLAVPLIRSGFSKASSK